MIDMRFATLAILFGTTLVQNAYGVGIVTDVHQFTAQQFDYLIVGGGTAGLALASRLSENPLATVGVLEAGQNYPDDPLIFTPALFGFTQGDPKYDWLLKTVPQPGLGNRVLDQPRGKILGGSSALNYMAYDRGSAAEYDAWKPFGGSGWSWSGLLPYFKKVETFHAAMVNTPFHDPQTIDTRYEGIHGPVQVSLNNWYSDITGPYLAAVNKLHIPTSTSPDDGNATGVFNCRMSVNRTSGRRSYAENTYHAIAAPRPNYFVLLGADVTKVNFAGHTSPVKATGVTFVFEGSTYSVNASDEIIISAGSLKTPQLLELSGIGAADRLRKFNIPVIVDLPGVGDNLQDHIFIPSSFALKPGFTTFDILSNDPTFAAAQNATYYHNGTGIYAATHSAFAFFGLQTFIDSATVSTLLKEAVQEAESTNPSPLGKAEINAQSAYVKAGDVGQVEIIMYPGHFSPSAAVPGVSYISILMALQHPWSRGTVHINTTDWSKPPLINPQYFENDFDLQVMIKACKLARRISQAEPLKGAITSEQDPGVSVETDAEYEAYIKGALESVYHPIGTAALAPRALGGVVDGQLKVYGTQNLRVVDASIMPLHLATHIQQTVYAIAEKAADIIKAGGTH